MRFFLDWLFKNQTISQTIAKNTFWLFSGQIVGRLLRAAIVIYAARALGAAGWGAFSYALGIAAFLTIFSDIGINALITKEASRNPELKDRYLSTAFFTKLGLLLILVLGVIAFFPYLTNIEEAAMIMPILIFVFAFDTLRDLGSAVSRALEKMEIEAGIHVLTNFAIVILGFIFLTLNPSSYSLAFAYAAGSGIGLLAILFVLRSHFRNLIGNFRKELIKPIISTAWPFGLMGLMGAIMLNTDIIMLGWLRTAEEVGFYSAAQKPIQLLYILPSLLASSIFPILTRLVKQNIAEANIILKKYVKRVVIFSIPIVIAGVALATPIINLLFGAEYLPAVVTFQLLILTVAVVYPSTLLGNAIFAYDHQKSFVTFVGAAAFGNVAFNLLLIPPFGIEGAAVSTIITQLLTNALIWRKARQIKALG
ncbi:MAG: flippase [Candidatus Harrisonbacteria bacterium]|nr:flippase [Candidatus Harrisonbacteria bacterium]